MVATSLMSVAIWRSDLTSLTQAGIWHRGHLACSLQSAFSIQPLHSRLRIVTTHTFTHVVHATNTQQYLKCRLHCPTSRSPPPPSHSPSTRGLPTKVVVTAAKRRWVVHPKRAAGRGAMITETNTGSRPREHTACRRHSPHGTVKKPL